jgi:tetratricopeptide (TPR) repeat protein
VDLDDRLEELERFAPLAPAAAAVEAARLRSLFRTGRGLTPRHAARLRALVRAARAEAGRPLHPAVDFPVALEGAGPAWLRGAVMRAFAVGPGQGAPPGAEPLATRFRDGAALEARLDALVPADGVRCFVGPARAVLAPAVAALPLEGDSCLAACALSRLAAQRGVLPAAAVVSASLSAGPGGAPVLRPVGHGEPKLAAAACERPSVPVYLCTGEPPSVSGVPTPRALLPGTALELLAERLLPAAGAALAAVLARLREADTHFALQRYAECRPLYAEVLRALASLPKRASPPQVATWRTQAQLRLAAVELHAGRTTAARRLFSRARARAPGMPPLLRAEAVAHVAGVLVDGFAPREALAVVGPVLRAWRRRVGHRRASSSTEERFALLSLLGVMRRAHLLEGRPDRALAVQEELLAWAPPAQRARSLCDLAEVLRRLGRTAEARRALARARHACAPLFDVERAHVEGFIAWVDGLLQLEAARPRLAPGPLEARAAALPPGLAARWRLEQLAELGRLAAGDASALDRLATACRAEPSPLRRWLRCLGLLRACRLYPEKAHVPWVQTAALLRPLLPTVRAHPELMRAARAFVTAARKGSPPDALVDPILRFSAY